MRRRRAGGGAGGAGGRGGGRGGEGAVPGVKYLRTSVSILHSSSTSTCTWISVTFHQISNIGQISPSIQYWAYFTKYPALSTRAHGDWPGPHTGLWRCTPRSWRLYCYSQCTVGIWYPYRKIFSKVVFENIIFYNYVRGPPKKIWALWHLNWPR